MSNILSRVFRNNITAVLTAGINSSATSLSVQTGQGAGFALETGQHIRATLTQGSTIEIINVTARSGDTLTIQRGQEGTTPAAFTAGASISIRWTAETINEIVGVLATLNPVFPGSVWVPDIWNHSLDNFTEPPSPDQYFSILETITGHASYVNDAFMLGVGDWVEVRTSVRLTYVVGGLAIKFVRGESIIDRSFSFYGSDLAETQDGSQWLYRYTIVSGDVNETYPEVLLSTVQAIEHNSGDPPLTRYYDVVDIVTSKGSLQSGSLADPQQMTVPYFPGF